jgi:spore germination protein YaaH
MKRLARILALLTGLPLLGACGVFYTLDTKGAGGGGGKPLELSGWLVFWDPQSWRSFQAHVGALARVYPEAYSCRADGGIGRVDATTPKAMADTVALAHAHGCKVLGMMNNYANGDFDRTRVERFLYDSGLMEQHVQGLLALARQDGVDGLDVDYENLAAGDRAAFTAFVRRLAGACHAQGLLLGVAAHPKESEPGTWDAPKAQDWQALGEAVDFFQPMTYDYHWASGAPGTIAPPPWVRSVIGFAASQMPAAKVELGLKTAGVDWSGKGQDLPWPKFLALQNKAGRAQRDGDTAELTLTAPGGGEVWMPDADTAELKFRIARDLGVRGVAMWVLGSEDPRVWAAFAAFNQGAPDRPAGP